MASNGHSRASVRSERQVPTTKASGGGNPPARPRASSTKRASRVSVDDANDSVRVRVAVRVRPKTTEELNSDFADCVELQPEVSCFMVQYEHLYLISQIKVFFGQT